MSQFNKMQRQGEVLLSPPDVGETRNEDHAKKSSFSSSIPLPTPPLGDASNGLNSEKKGRGRIRDVQSLGEGRRGNNAITKDEISSGVNFSESSAGNAVDSPPVAGIVSSTLYPNNSREHSSVDNRGARTSTSHRNSHSSDGFQPRLSACQLPPPAFKGSTVDYVRELDRKSLQTVPSKKAERRYHCFQRLTYPFTVRAESPKGSESSGDGNRSSVKNLPFVPGLDAAADLEIPEGDELESAKVSALALSTFTDPVSGAGVYGVLLGDMKGDVEYVEISSSDENNQLIRNSRLAISKTGGSRHCLVKGDEDRQNQLTEAMTEGISKDLRGREVFRRIQHSAYIRAINALNSVIVDPGVKCVSFIPNSSPSVVSYLTANQRTVKLFRIRREGFSPLDFFPGMESLVQLYPATLSSYGRFPAPQSIFPVKEFGPTANSIQQLSLCADCQTFMSVEDLQLFLWDMEASSSTQGSCIVNLSPPSGNLNDIEELITAANFHPSHGSLFLMSRSSGVFNIGDLRDPPCRPSRKFSLSSQISAKHNRFFSESYNEILCSICAASFLGNDNVVTRDYLSLKLWDLRNVSSPCATVSIMAFALPFLDLLYNNDQIFDRFPLAVDHVTNTVVTGLYDTTVAVWQPLTSPKSFHYYRGDSLVDPSDFESTAHKIPVSELQHKVQKGNKEPSTPLCEGDGSQLLTNRVACLDIAPGGERIAFSAADGKQIFVFENDTDEEVTRKPSK